MVANHPVNNNHKQTATTRNLQDTDETKLLYYPKITKTGNIPHLSYVFQKVELLRMEFKNCLDSTSKIMLCLYLCRNKDDHNTYDNDTNMKTV